MSDLRRLGYFLAVAQERNFTRAADRLHVAQSALSRQIRLLERELGVTLLHRTTHEVELTEAGAFLLDRGPGLLAANDALWAAVRGFGAGRRGTVTIAYGASASYETAPRLVAAVTDRLPEIALETEVRPTQEIVAAVRDGSLDLGLVRCPPAAEDLRVLLVRRERQGVLLHREHRLSGASDVDLLDLDGEPILLHRREANPDHYDAVLRLCRDRGAQPPVQHRALTFDLVETPLVRREAVAIVGESSRHGVPADLRWVPITPPATFDVGLVSRRRGGSPAVGRVVAAAGAAAAELGWTA